MECVLGALFDNIFNMDTPERGSSAHQGSVDVFLNAAKFTKHDEGHDQESLSLEDFRTWCTLLPSVRKFLGSLLIPPHQGFLISFIFILWICWFCIINCYPN